MECVSGQWKLFFLSEQTVFESLEVLEYCQEKKLKSSARKACLKYVAATSAWKVGIQESVSVTVTHSEQ